MGARCGARERCSTARKGSVAARHIIMASTDKEPLLEPSTPVQASPQESKLAFLKYGSLGFLIVQNSSQCVALASA